MLPEQLASDQIPGEVIQYLSFVKTVGITDTIEYEELRKLFKKFLQRLKVNLNTIEYEWVIGSVMNDGRMCVRAHILLPDLAVGGFLICERFSLSL